MRVVLILVVLSVVLGWAAYEMRARNQGVSQVLLGFAILFALMLLLAFFNLI